MMMTGNEILALAKANVMARRTPAPLDDPRFDGLSDRARSLFCEAQEHPVLVSKSNRIADEIVAAGLGRRVNFPGSRRKLLVVSLGTNGS